MPAPHATSAGTSGSRPSPTASPAPIAVASSDTSVARASPAKTTNPPDTGRPSTLTQRRGQGAGARQLAPPQHQNRQAADEHDHGQREQQPSIAPHLDAEDG